MFITFSASGNDVISLELIFVYFYTRIQSSSNTIYKAKYPEEYSTFDKVGSEKLFARKSCFV